jgi:hypothetical protein
LRFNPDLWHFLKLEEKTSRKAAVNFSLQKLRSGHLGEGVSGE